MSLMEDVLSDDTATVKVDGKTVAVTDLPWWRRPRRLRRQLVGALLIIAFLSVALVGILNFIAGRQLLDQGTQDKLAGIGEARSRSIETGIDSILAQVSVAAGDLAVVQAVDELDAGFADLADEELGSAESAELSAFYEEALIRPLADAGITDLTLDEIVPQSTAAEYLQYHYVLAELDQLEARRTVTDAGDGSTYSAVHAETHPALTDISEALGFGDMLIVSARSNEIIYSVDKRIDLGIDLDSGPLASSQLAETVLSKLSRVPVGTAVIADQGIYLPGGGRPVVFVAASVRRDTEVIGALVAQIPIETLDLVTTAGGNWEQVGLGEGESYVVGADRLLRSESRLWIEDPDRYLDEIDDDELRTLVAAFGSPVGLQPVETEPARAAFEGQVFEGTAENYLGNRTFSYATPIKAAGVDWIVVADVPLSDARGPLTDYSKRLGLVLLIILPAAGLLGFMLANRLARPIPPVVDAAFAVAAGDRDPDIPDLGGDEFGDLARQLKNMARDLGDRETALAAEYEETRQLLLTVLPPRLVKNGSELNPESDVADVATVIAVGVDLTRGGVEVDESEIASLMDRVRDVAEETAERAGVERVRAGADRYLFLSGLSDTDDGADRALGFASDLSQRLAALALLEDAPMTSRIGVSTGPVATGVLQKGSLTFGAWGEPVRRALAISAISPADQVLVDDSSRASLTDQKWPLDPADDVGGLDGGAMVLFSLSVPPAEDATPGEDTK